MKRWAIIAFIGVGAALAPGASAATVSGLVSGGYAWFKAEGYTLNAYGGNGSALIDFDDTNFNLQLGGGGAKLDAEGLSANLLQGDAHFFWRDTAGTLGFSVGYDTLSILVDLNATTYGAFGEWYAMPELSLRAKGGGVTVSADFLGFNYDDTGAYGGAGAEYYITPDLGIYGEYDYLSVVGTNIHLASGGVEYLFSHEYPVSLAAGYQYGDMSGGFVANGLMVRLKYRFGLNGSLVDIDRNGPVGWSGLISFL